MPHQRQIQLQYSVPVISKVVVQEAADASVSVIMLMPRWRQAGLEAFFTQTSLALPTRSMR